MKRARLQLTLFVAVVISTLFLAGCSQGESAGTNNVPTTFTEDKK